MADANPTAAELRADFSYDPQSGRLTRISGQRAGRRVGYMHGRGYIMVSYRRRIYFAHRVAWCLAHGEWPVGEIDHLNGDKADNRLANLRDVTPQENSQNRHGPLRSNGSGLLGVTPTKSGGYMARMFVAGKRHYLGVHATAQAAHEAYKAAKMGKNFRT